jgi:4-methylaminobutanoate oxidase (formaldehyde-forming)
VLALRVTYVGELGYELYMPPEYAGHIYELLWEEGHNLGIANAGYRAIDSLRLEKGYRYRSADVTPDYNPYDAGLGFCVALEKEEFIGREALVKIREKGPKWKLCCFTLDTDRPMLLSGGETICYRSNVLGVVTSGGYGHTVRKAIAYGYVPVEDSNHNDGYEIEVYKEVIPATRHERTLYDPERKRILI